MSELKKQLKSSIDKLDQLEKDLISESITVQLMRKFRMSQQEINQQKTWEVLKHTEREIPPGIQAILDARKFK